MHLRAIQVGSSAFLRVGQRTLRSAIRKRSVAGPVAVGPLGLVGDEQNDLSVHGGLRKAVYALPAQHLDWWTQWRATHVAGLFDSPVQPGDLGDNLSLDGVDESQLWLGDHLCFGPVVLRITEPRQPCGKFNAVMGHEQAARDMVRSGRSGFYLAVEVPGVLTPGQAFEVLPGPRQVTVVQALGHKAYKHLR